MRGAGRRSPAVAPAAAVLAVAAVLVVLTIAAGPVDVQEPSWLGGGEVDVQPQPVEPLPTAEPGPTATPPAQSGDPVDVDVPWPALIVVAVAAGAYLLYYLVRRLLPELGLRGERRRPVLGGRVEALADPVEELRDGARSAASALSGPAPDAAEAVVAAWLALESAAAGSGAPRGPAQTPTEFTAALLRHHHAEEDAVATLLGLYHRARFAVSPDLGAADVETARRALRTIVTTLGASAVPP
jgi:hypothetical protein